MELIYGTIIGVFFIVIYILGIRMGIAISKGKEPTIINPIKAIKEAKEEEKSITAYKQKMAELDIVDRNVDVYDGSPNGQIPIEIGGK